MIAFPLTMARDRHTYNRWWSARGGFSLVCHQCNVRRPKSKFPSLKLPWADELKWGICEDCLTVTSMINSLRVCSAPRCYRKPSTGFYGCGRFGGYGCAQFLETSHCPGQIQNHWPFCERHHKQYFDAIYCRHCPQEHDRKHSLNYTSSQDPGTPWKLSLKPSPLMKIVQQSSSARPVIYVFSKGHTNTAAVEQL